MVPIKHGSPFHIWRSLVEKAGYKISDIPNTWDAFLDFFNPVQDKFQHRECAISMPTAIADC